MLPVVIITGTQPNFGDYVLSLGIVRPEDCIIVERPRPEDTQGAHLIGFGLLFRHALFAAKVTHFNIYFGQEHKGRYDLSVEELAQATQSHATYELKRVS